MRIYIFYNFQQGPWGGGNQFLKALKKEFEKQGVYGENPEKADVILFNSYHWLKQVLKLKSKHPEKILIHRLGPIFHYHRGRFWKRYDKKLIKMTNKISEGVIFQSNWSLKESLKLGFNEHKAHCVIYNASDNKVFNRDNKKPFNPAERIKLIAVSWSPNWKKGFDIYKYLDENLDFSKYEMTFMGNSPLGFKNINWIKPVSPEKLAEILKEHDIFITAAQKDACSNSLIEALSCGLPAVALNDGGHPELLGRGGELFNKQEEVLSKIKKVAANYQHYQSQIPEFSIKKTAQQYYEFAKKNLS